MADISKGLRNGLKPALVALACAGLVGCTTVGPDGRLAEDPLGNFEQRLIGNTLVGLGLAAPEREPIDYTPRGPLVMPPARGQAASLPAPVDPNARAAQNPNWPRDPDRLRADAALRERTRPLDAQYQREVEGRRMTVEEMQAQASGAARINAPSETFRDRGVVLSREELERGWSAPRGGLFSPDETIDMTQGPVDSRGTAQREIDRNAGGPGGIANGSRRVDTAQIASRPEPPRRTLVDPPAGLRTAAPDPTGGRLTEEEQSRRSFWDRLWGR